MRNKAKHINWMNLATHVACLILSRTLNCGLQDFHCSAKVGPKGRHMPPIGTKTKVELAWRNKSNDTRITLDDVANEKIKDHVQLITVQGAEGSD